MAETKILLEREYIVPLRPSFIKTPYYKKTPKSIKALCEFIAKNMKVEHRDTRKVKIDKYLNEYLWQDGIASPKGKIKVKAKKLDNGDVIVELVDMPENLKFKMEREKRSKEEAFKRKEAKKKAQEKSPEEQKEEAKNAEEKKEALAETELAQAKEEHKEHKHESAEKVDKSPEKKKAIRSNSR